MQGRILSGSKSLIVATAMAALLASAFAAPDKAGRKDGATAPKPSEMLFATLEDFYGQTGKRFQAAFGFRNFEATANSPVAPKSYGVAVDDMVISWKETRLDADTHDCAGSGECANIQLSSGLSYDSTSLVEVTVSDKTPYDNVHGRCTSANIICSNDAQCSGFGTCDNIGTAWNKNNCNNDFVCSQNPAKSCTQDSDCLAGEGTCTGDYTDAVDDQDCDNDGTPDVVVKLISDAEVAGEVAVLNQTSPGAVTYRTHFPYSFLYDSVGTLYMTLSGTSNPAITALYEDRNDGTGSRCLSSLDPTRQGLISANTTVINVTAGRIDLKTYSMTLVGRCSVTTTTQCATPAECPAGEACVTQFTYGDNDGIADTNETIDMPVTFVNKSGLALDDLTATLATSDPKIECISRPIVSVPAGGGTVANNATVTSAPFRFKVANVNRTSVDQDFKATFTITLRSKQFDVVTRTMTLTTDLDLSVSGGSGPLEFIEDFTTTANMGKFTIATLDAGKNSLAASNGYRCQYNDPDALNSNSAGDVDCFLGFTGDPANGVNDWHVHSSASGGLGRAYTGNLSVHWGVHLGSTPKRDTGRYKQLDAIQTINAVALGLANTNPELNFAHQVSLVDNRGIGGITNGEVADRAIVQINVLTSTGSPTTWVKIYPYQNSYEQQGTDDFTNCTFDPTDDGNNEDDYFNPSDPNRRLGPSSTCYPEFVFSRSGDTDYRFGYNPTHVGLADAGSALKGSIDVGTWVRPRFSLVAYAARRIRLRFLGTSIELGASQTWDSFFGRDDQPQDDGWYLDDIHIVGALGGTPYTVTQDTRVITGLPTCTTGCASITAGLVATPSTTAGPGQLVSLEAKTSTIDLCANGIRQYQYWLDANGNSIVGDAGDTLVRDWTDNSTFVDAPQVSTRYGVKVRCSSNPSCDQVDGSSATTALVTVPCPSTGLAKARFVPSIVVNKTSLGGAEPDVNTTVNWFTTALVDAIRGNLIALRAATGNYAGTVQACIANNVSGTSLPVDATNPGVGGALYYLVRPAAPVLCNETGGLSYGTGHPSEVPGSGGNRDADIALDPNACP